MALDEFLQSKEVRADQAYSVSLEFQLSDPTF